MNATLSSSFFGAKYHLLLEAVKSSLAWVRASFGRGKGEVINICQIKCRFLFDHRGSSNMITNLAHRYYVEIDFNDMVVHPLISPCNNK